MTMKEFRNVSLVCSSKVAKNVKMVFDLGTELDIYTGNYSLLPLAAF